MAITCKKDTPYFRFRPLQAVEDWLAYPCGFYESGADVILAGQKGW